MRQREVLLLLVLVVSCFSGGCASRRSVLDPEADSTAVARIRAEPLRIGDRLELQLRDGSEAHGFLRGITPDSLTLGATRTPDGRHDRRPPQAHTVALAEVRAGIRDQGGGREPLLLLEGPGGSGLALFAQPIERGDLLYWQTRDGVCGAGYFIALEADTLVLADNQRWHRYYTRGRPPTLAEAEEKGAVCRLALAEVTILSQSGSWTDNHAVRGVLATLVVTALAVAFYVAEGMSRGL